MRKILKKSISLLLAITIVFGSAIISSIKSDFDVRFAVKTHAASVNDLSFNFDYESDCYYVTNCDMYASGSITIPSTYEGYNVEGIDDYAFYNCEYLTSVVIPDTVSFIEVEAFSFCSNLTSVSLGKGVRYIGTNAFYGCTNLTSITFPSSLKEIYSSCFQNCSSLKTITIPDSVQYCGDLAFKDCDNLSNVTIGSGLTYLSDALFQNCTNLKSIVIGKNVVSIGEDVFEFCTNLESVTLPVSVSEIGWGAFYSCSSLQNVYYLGSVYDRDTIYVDDYNDDLVNAQWIYSGSVPDTPKVKAVNTLKGVNITWNAISGAVKYVVYKRLGTSSTWSIVATTTGTSYEDKGTLYAGKYYVYSVKAYNYEGTSSNYIRANTFTIQRVIAPYTYATNIDNGINVTWGKVAGATKYVVYRRQSGYSSWTNVGTTTGTSLLDKNVTSGVYYLYSVRAVNNTGYSAYDSNKSVLIRRIISTVIPTPTTTAINVIDGVQIKWNAIAGATNYAVYRRSGGSSTWYLVDFTKNTSLTDYDVYYDGTYYVYSVRAYKGAAYSPYNSSKTDTIQPIDTPYVEVYSNLSPEVDIYWDSIEGARKYNIYRRTDYSSWQLIKTTTDTYYYDGDGIELEVTYRYAVRAVNGTGISAYDYNKTNSVACYSGGE